MGQHRGREGWGCTGGGRGGAAQGEGWGSTGGGVGHHRGRGGAAQGEGWGSTRGAAQGEGWGWGSNGGIYFGNIV